MATTLEMPDLIIMEGNTISADKVEALRQIKSDPITNSIPVIILSAQEDEDQTQYNIWRQHGAFDCLTNHWTFEQLRLRLQAALGSLM